MTELSWQKSIEVCRVVKGVVPIAEHPVTLTAATANVSAVSSRVSQEAYEGSAVCLINAIHDVDGTQGNSFHMHVKPTLASPHQYITC